MRSNPNIFSIIICLCRNVAIAVIATTAIGIRYNLNHTVRYDFSYHGIFLKFALNPVYDWV